MCQEAKDKSLQHLSFLQMLLIQNTTIAKMNRQIMITLRILLYSCQSGYVAFCLASSCPQPYSVYIISPPSQVSRSFTHSIILLLSITFRLCAGVLPLFPPHYDTEEKISFVWQTLFQDKNVKAIFQHLRPVTRRSHGDNRRYPGVSYSCLFGGTLHGFAFMRIKYHVNWTSSKFELLRRRLKIGIWNTFRAFKTVRAILCMKIR